MIHSLMIYFWISNTCISAADIWKFQSRDPHWRILSLLSVYSGFYPDICPALVREKSGHGNQCCFDNHKCRADMCGWLSNLPKLAYITRIFSPPVQRISFISFPQTEIVCICPAWYKNAEWKEKISFRLLCISLLLNCAIFRTTLWHEILATR